MKAKNIAKPATKADKPEGVKLGTADTHVGYNTAGRFPATAYRAAMVTRLSESKLKALTFPMSVFLLTKGAKGVLANKVKYNNETGFYSRKNGETELIGNVLDLEEIPDLTPEILTAQELAARAAKVGKVFLFKRRSDDKEVTLALLNKNTDSYVVGVTIENNELVVYNTEPAAKYNTKKVQWVQIRDVTDGKLLHKLTNFRPGAVKAST